MNLPPPFNNKNMEQLLAHLIGDYILQSHDMATKKVNSSFWAFLHAFTYTIPFLFITENKISLSIILFTHFLIDRFRLAKYVTRYKNILLGKYETYSDSYDEFFSKDKKDNIYKTDTGFPKETPTWLSVWLMIIADNTLHLIINYIALFK